MIWLFMFQEWDTTKMTYQSGLSEEISIKSFRYFFYLVKLADCLISSESVIHNFIPRNIRAFWHFDFEYRRITIFFIYSGSGFMVMWYKLVIKFLSKVNMISFTDISKHFAYNKVIIHTFNLDKLRTHL